MENSTAAPKIIIMEGVDRTGKNTLQEEIDKQTKYKHIVIDRGPIGFIAYCEIFNKDQSLFDQYVKIEDQLAKIPEVLVIYLTADTEVLLDRCVQTNHEVLDFDLHKSYYKESLETSPLKHIKVDTSKKHVREIVQDLIKEGVL